MDVSKWYSIMMTIGLSLSLIAFIIEVLSATTTKNRGEIQIKSLINVNKTTLPNDDTE